MNVFYEHLSVVGDVVDMLKVLKVLRNNDTSPAFALCDHESNVCVLNVIQRRVYIFSYFVANVIVSGYFC